MFGLKKATINTIGITGAGIAFGTVFLIPAALWLKSKLTGLAGNVGI